MRIEIYDHDGELLNATSVPRRGTMRWLERKLRAAAPPGADVRFESGLWYRWNGSRLRPLPRRDLIL